jgi:hypothetical protein
MAIYYSETTKGFYNTSELEYNNLPGDIIELTENEYNHYLFEINSNNKFIIVADDGVIMMREKVVNVTWDNIRERRDNLLASSDHTQLPDYPGDKIAWATYRQELRDIPQNFASPDLVIFPEYPI